MEACPSYEIINPINYENINLEIEEGIYGGHQNGSNTSKPKRWDEYYEIETQTIKDLKLQN